jgi:peptide deformylase
MILPIVKYPDPILQRPTQLVKEFNEELQTLVDNMFESMYHAQGIGLAAPQVGVSKRVAVVDLSFGKDPAEKIVLANPEIIFSQGKQVEDEGCLSLPEIRDKVSRALHIKVKAQDAKGEWFERDAEELLSRCFQHEIDHLDGILFIYRISSLKRELALRKIRKMQRAGEW